MPLIDDRGRLFGRVNVIDAGLVAFLLVLMPIVYTATRLFRVPTPVMESVDPATQPIGPGRRIRVHGRNLRPYMKALIGETGQPFVMLDPSPLTRVGNILLETSSSFEVELPPLGPGSYDLHLFDTTQEVALLPRAFSLTAEAHPPRLVRARIRFIAIPEVARLVREQDVANTEALAPPAGSPGAPSAPRLGAVRVVAANAPAGVELSAGWGVTILEADVDIPVRENAKGEWEYGQKIIRIGEGFTFQTARYTMSGRIGEIAPLTPAAPGAPVSEGK